jgi:PelA/Pel-15E family pectate lyase
MKQRAALVIGAVLLGMPGMTAARAQDNLDVTRVSPSPEEAHRAMGRAVEYFAGEVATQGGYLWEYTPDLAKRWGEGEARDTQIWVQPPGTPSVGAALLRACERTGDTSCCDAARAAAHALIRGQLASGGWHYWIDFDPGRSRTQAYRHHPPDGASPVNRYNVTTFDDDTTQSALRFLMRYDQATGFHDRKVHEAVEYALQMFLKAQYPAGGWPQRYEKPCNPDDWPVRAAHYPETWSRTYAGKTYYHCYTLNDDTTADCIRTMLLAHDIYGHSVHLDSARRGGDFLILAQMPDPQPAWAQQYGPDMTPAWARRFEPPAIVTRESVGVIHVLMELYAATGDDRYCQPIPRALEWMERSRLHDGQVARFYELETNRPLYFTRQYELVYIDDDLPTHYSFKTQVDVDGLRKQYEHLDQRRAAWLARPAGHRWPEPSRAASPDHARRVIDDLDGKGRWIEDGRVDCALFIRNLDTLSTYIARADETTSSGPAE